ncbi:MAG: NAD-dependent epimerase/dehydratase family protein [Opitutaceae bacterium]|jgi:CDP-paratose 2-epimerase
MKILITGICGFVGSTLARALHEAGHEITGFDSYIRPGSETNREPLLALGIRVLDADLRFQSQIDTLPPVDFVIDAAANPSVLAGVDGHTSSRELVDHNLYGTVNLLEYCKRHRAGFVLLSTSRVYSIPPLSALPVEVISNAFRPSSLDSRPSTPPGLTAAGVDETFSTLAPVSLYGATKLASETLALDYGAAFDFPVWINRCGVLAGAGQFGRPDQGIFAYWINSHLRRRPLKYIGFDGIGHQVRDCLHPRDLAPLLLQQLSSTRPLTAADRIINCSGGAASARSLRQLHAWCDTRFGAHSVASDPQPRPFDIPWMVLDSAKALRLWNWSPATGTDAICEEIAAHAEAHPHWLELSAPL